MNIQTVFKAGNSNVVAIPTSYLKDLNLKTGQKVLVEQVPETKSILITPVAKKASQRGLTKEFKQWLAQFLHEDKELLDDLANR